MTSRTRILAVGAIAAWAGLARASDDGAPQISVTLAEVKAFPEAYRKVPFDLALMFHGPRDVYNPFYTVFEPSTYLNFAAWPADAPIFTREGYANDYPLFYVERKNLELQQMVVAMKSGTWFNARCVVRSTAQDRAWIEVLTITQAGPTLDTSDLRHLVRANALAGNGEFERALVEVEMARLFGAPPRFVARCRGEEGRIALAANQPDRAIVALQQAAQFYPDDKAVTAMLDRASSQVALARQQQMASVPIAPPPPLHPNDRKPVVPTVPSVEPQAPQPTPTPDATPVEAPKSDAPKSDDSNKETPKSDDSKKDAGEKKDDAKKDETTPAAKPEPTKPEETPKPDAPAPTEPKPAEPTPSTPPAPAPEAKPSDAPKPAEPAKPDPSKPEAKPNETPASKPEPKPDAPKPDESPKPDAKPNETPSSDPNANPDATPDDDPNAQPSDEPTDDDPGVVPDDENPDEPATDPSPTPDSPTPQDPPKHPDPPATPPNDPHDG